MSHFPCPSYEIEEIDLTGDPEPKLSGEQVRVLKLLPYQESRRLTPMQQSPHSKRQSGDLNRPLSRKREDTVWRCDGDDLFGAMEQSSASMDRQDRNLYPYRHSPVGMGSVNARWQSWAAGDFHPVNESNDSSPELLILEDMKQSLRCGDAAVKDIWTEIASAQRLLEVAVTPPNSRDPSLLPAAMTIIFKDLSKYLHAVEKSRQESKEQVELLDIAVRSLVRAFRPSFHMSASCTNCFFKDQSQSRLCRVGEKKTSHRRRNDRFGKVSEAMSA